MAWGLPLRGVTGFGFPVDRVLPSHLAGGGREMVPSCADSARPLNAC